LSYSALRYDGSCHLPAFNAFVTFVRFSRPPGVVGQNPAWFVRVVIEFAALRTSGGTDATTD
jgi:hypothetical protein